MRPFLVLLACLAVAGCDSGEERAPGRDASLLIGDWLGAVNAGEYNRAASFFAPGAVVDQGRPIRLRDRAAARFFNATLPCRADLIEVRDRPGPDAVASFRLRAGPGGPCDGIDRVLFTIRQGRFTAWRRLRDRQGPVV